MNWTINIKQINFNSFGRTQWFDWYSTALRWSYWVKIKMDDTNIFNIKLMYKNKDGISQKDVS